MKNKEQKKQNKQSVFDGLLGAANGAKSSGATFTLETILPVAISLFFIIVIGAFGLLNEGTERKSWYIYTSLLITPISSALVALFYFKWTKKSIKTAVAEQKCHPKYFFWAILLQLGLLSLSELNNLLVFSTREEI